ncbi:MAG: hypothetical protein V1857_00320, partial [archaeon]
ISAGKDAAGNERVSRSSGRKAMAMSFLKFLSLVDAPVTRTGRAYLFIAFSLDRIQESNA